MERINLLQKRSPPRRLAGLGGYLIYVVASVASVILVANTVSRQPAPSQVPGSDIFVGHWTYRSFLNRAEQVDDINQLLFAEAELVFEKVSSREVRGALNMGETGSLTIKGTVVNWNPVSFRFQGVGEIAGSPSQGWIYDYIGWYVPAWPNGVDQKPAIVGSVIRTVAHSNGQAKAGVVASFIAIKRD